MNSRLLTFLAALALPAMVQAAPRPKLIVAISIDQFSADLFREYRPTFTGGLRRIAGGIVYANGYQAHAATETCPGHATILTGVHPTRSGIVANNWTDTAAPREDKSVYCAEDERAPGSTSRDYTPSDVHLRVDTLGDRMKAANSASRVVAVAGKDRSAIMMGGHRTDQRWFWSKDRYVAMAGNPPSAIADAINANVARALSAPRLPLEVPDFCRSKDVAVPIGGGKTVGTHRFQREAGDIRRFLASPEADGATLALAAGLVQQMRLGDGSAPDLLAIGLSATDYVGHTYGPGGVEMCLQLTALDRDIGDFLAFLDERTLDYAVVLTADHGGLDIPERTRASGVPDAARIDPAILPAGLGEAIGKQLGIAGPVLIGDYYVAPDVPAARRAEVLALATQLLTAHGQVEEVHGRADVAAVPMPRTPPERWSIIERMRASYDPVRSGDLLVAYKENITPIPDTSVGYVSTHGSVWDHDRKVPIAFWWKGVAPSDRSESAMTVDIMPTLAAMIGLAVPAGSVDGRCLEAVAGSGCSAQ